MKNLDKKEFLNIFLKLVQPSLNNLIGVEIEHLVVEKNTRHNASYDKIKELLERINLKWGGELLLEHGVLVGIKFNTLSISLEPGGQFEISIDPKLNILGLEAEYFTFLNRLKPILNDLSLEFLSLGNSPLFSHKDINIVPKPRYIAMDNYLPGRLLRVMMRETTSIQVAVDYNDEFDAIEKFRTANLISPVVTAMFSNSPVRLGKLTSYKSYRALAWLHTDNDRCGFIHKTMLDESFGFEQMFEDIINVPMVFIERGQKTIPVNGKLTFAQFIQKGFYGYNAIESDLKLQTSLIFPEVRVKGYLELRNQDCLPDDMKFAPVALYAGLFKGNESLQRVKTLVQNISFEELKQAREDVCQQGMNTRFGGYFVHELAKELLVIANDNLGSDKKYLAKISKLVDKKQSPADLIINKWNTYSLKKALLSF